MTTAFALDDLLGRVLELDGSDLHLTVGVQPSVRVNGELVRLTEYPMLKPADVERLVAPLLDQRRRERFERELELDAAYSLPGKGRFRVNIFRQRDSLGAVLRAIPHEIVPLEVLGLPPIVASFAEIARGLVLVTGPTGSGKSTTLATIVDLINRSRAVHIMTVEDPIEFLHRHAVGTVNQREVGEDTLSFAAALKHVLRQDPDVIMIGELRDLETIQTALTAAETGHLVLASVHTQSAGQTIDRIIDVFPAHQQAQVRTQLAMSIQAIVAQQLVPTADGGRRSCAAEILVATPAVRNLIREGKAHQLETVMQSGARNGMQTMAQALADLVRRGIVTQKVAETLC